MITKQWVFFDAGSTSSVSNELGLLPSDGLVTVQVNTLVSGSTFSVKFQGLVDLAENNWSDIDTVSMKSFDTSVDITEDGIYAVPVSGMYKLRAVLADDSQAGTVKVYGNMIA